MTSHRLIRWGGLAAALAGALRILTAFWPSANPGAGVEALYLAIDLLILFGILGIYALHAERLGRTGLAGFVLAVGGTAIIAGPDGAIGPVGMYPAGSLALGLGLVFLAVASWIAGALPRWIGILWILSTASGILAAASGMQSLLVASGVAFGLAFIGAGANVWVKSVAPANSVDGSHWRR